MKLQKFFPNKTPLDVKIVVFLLVISAFIEFLVFLLLLLGIATHPLDYKFYVCGGLFCIGSTVASGTYSLLSSIACLVGAYGLAKRHKFGWWFMIILVSYNIVDSVLLFNDYPTTTSIGICFGVIIIVWLILRRKFYHINNR